MSNNLFMALSMCIATVFITAQILFPRSASAENWKSFVPDDKAGGQQMLYDLDSKKKVSEAITRIWIKREAKEQTENKKGAPGAAKSFYLVEMNCQERMYRILTTSEYSKDGKMLGFSQSDDAAWYYVVPESTISYLQRTLCQK